MDKSFQIEAGFQPTGDQPEAISKLVKGLAEGRKFQTLEGVTGSGKTFTIANTIARHGRPALVLSHNKTLAAQLYAELKTFFPNNAVEYFISYYDYYQPEAYIPQTDTFIEKDSSINEEIERLRLAATDALLNRDDVIIVASISCIYGLGSPEDYKEMVVSANVGEELNRDAILKKLVEIQYERNDYEPGPGKFRVRGDTLDIFPSYAKDYGLRLEFWGDEIENIKKIDPLTGDTIEAYDHIMVSPAKHFVMPQTKIDAALIAIRQEMEQQVAVFERENRLIEAQRIKMRTEYDLEMLKEIGFCGGIENYSRHLAGRNAGDRPECLLDYFPDDFITIIDESHVTLSQVRGMYNGDQSRKRTLVDHGFRLPSALDNRPMNFDEFISITNQIIFLSATPGPYELEHGGVPVEQIIRPTGIVDPPVELRPLKNQIDDLMEEIRIRAERNERTLVTTLTKRTAEDLTEYLEKTGLKVSYLHSGIDALERVDILRELRSGTVDCLIGINLLREGLDLPEVSLVAILDADKEGFLRSETALVQTAGRAARHIDGRVIMYAEKITDSMQRMLDKCDHRRRKQTLYNKEHGIVPQAIKKDIQDSLKTIYETAEETVEAAVAEAGVEYSVAETLHQLEQEMMEAAEKLEFERAATLRDQIQALQEKQG
ncbi:excinuclease ABC subunit UvrB [Pontiella agarivorans]|uniref:UvrABC system protein B n=1 Tax=Pontiella agarivorans TaxID=3038953 RepID=A0ABU5MSU1_9BACT|nr:excinuclease ABC subunit UvrB [Pontiella agarivorans]MDZ8117206.1 excinuclease ABC subunit UvrB [Pontiella agarivorans]